MEWWKAGVLGAVQGLTEFLPISSSGHLVILQNVFHLALVPETLLAFDIFIHLGTLLSLVYVYQKELRELLRAVVRPFDDATRDAWQVIYLLVLGTLPSIVIGLACKDFVESQFASGQFLPYEFLLTAALLWSSKWAPHEARSPVLSPWHALAIGCAQAVAILPAVSRSGTTIVAGLWLGLGAARSAHYSFLLAIPAILGATVLSLVDVHSLAFFKSGYLWIGFFVSALVGWSCLVLFLKIVRRGQLYFFAYYCFAVAVLLFLSRLLLAKP